MADESADRGGDASDCIGGVAEIVRNVDHWLVEWVSLVAAASAIGLARARTVPNAMRLGRAADTPEMQTRLARAIFRDHLYCLVAMLVLLGVQLSTPL